MYRRYRLTYMLRSGDETFVVKRVPRQFYDLSQRLALEFDGSSRLRLHTDCNQEEGVLVFPYFKSTLLALIQSNPQCSTEGRRKILRHVGEAIQELHNKDWIHLGICSLSGELMHGIPQADLHNLADVKPDNVLVNSDYNREGYETVINAVLGDFDLIFKSENAEPCHTPYAIGNAMWRSPEGQTGRGLTKASDIYSFGLMVSEPFSKVEVMLILV